MQNLIFFRFFHISGSNSKSVLLNCLLLNPFVFILYQHLPPGSNPFLVATPQSPLDGLPAARPHCSNPPQHTYHCQMGLALSHSPSWTHKPHGLLSKALHETATLPSSQSPLALPVFLIHCPLPYLLPTPLLASCHLLVLCTPSRIFLFPLFSSNSSQSSKAQPRSHLLHEIE